MNILSQAFFKRDADIVARELLGKTLVSTLGEEVIRLPITETEAYMGPHDDACHAFKGRTKRTEVMYLEGGAIYIYLIYGMYWMLNIVTGEKDYPAAVLIRGVGEFNGPGKLTRGLGITKDLNGKRLGRAAGLWIEEGIGVMPENILIGPRVGIGYASETWREAPLRYIYTKG